MNGRAHQGDAAYFPIEQEASERLEPESLQPRPEAHIRRDGRLGLHSGQALNHLDRGKLTPA